MSGELETAPKAGEEANGMSEGSEPAEVHSDSGPEVEDSSEPASEAVAPEMEAQNTRTSRRQRSRKGKAAEAAEQTKMMPMDDDDDVPVKGAYHVELPEFEGPLDLLLHLIQQHELDIKNIPIAFVSQKYLEYIVFMQDLNIDLASEYLVMAATLAHIKSKMLLPKAPADQEDEDGEELDPRGELVRRLLEYQKYKHAAEKLGKSPVLGRDVFIRGAPAPSVDGPAPLAQLSVFKLFDAFQRLLSKVKQTAEHLIDVDRISISERIIELTDLLRGRGKVPFVELFNEESSRPDLIVSFLAVLEMTKLRMMLVHQEGPLEPIAIELTLTEEHDEILKKDFGEGDPLAALARGDVGLLEEDPQLSMPLEEGVSQPAELGTQPGSAAEAALESEAIVDESRAEAPDDAAPEAAASESMDSAGASAAGDSQTEAPEETAPASLDSVAAPSESSAQMVGLEDDLGPSAQPTGEVQMSEPDTSPGEPSREGGGAVSPSDAELEETYREAVAASQNEQDPSEIQVTIRPQFEEDVAGQANDIENAPADAGQTESGEDSPSEEEH